MAQPEIRYKFKDSAEDWQLGCRNGVMLKVTIEEHKEKAYKLGLASKKSQPPIIATVLRVLGQRRLLEVDRGFTDQLLDAKKSTKKNNWKGKFARIAGQVLGTKLSGAHSREKNRFIEELIAKIYNLKLNPSELKTSLFSEIENIRTENKKYSLEHMIRFGRTDEILVEASRIVANAADDEFIGDKHYSDACAGGDGFDSGDGSGLKSSDDGSSGSGSSDGGSTSANDKTTALIGIWNKLPTLQIDGGALPQSSNTTPTAKADARKDDDNNLDDSSGPLFLVGGKELIAFSHICHHAHNQTSNTQKSSKIPPDLDKEPNEDKKEKYKKFESYHWLYSTIPAMLLAYWHKNRVSTTISLVLSTTIVLALTWPVMINLFGTMPAIQWLMTQFQCTIFAAQSLYIIAAVFLTWVTISLFASAIQALSSPRNPEINSDRAMLFKKAKELLTTETKQDNIWSNNPINRLFSILCLIFNWLYDYGKSHPFAMTMFAIFYWFPATLILLNTYGNVVFTGFIGSLYQNIILPAASGLVAVAKSPWLAALACGFLFGKLALLAVNTAEKRSQGGLWGFIKWVCKNLIDTLCTVLGLLFLATIEAGIPIIENISGSWDAFNLMTATIKPVAFMLDCATNIRKSIVGSTLRCIFIIPYWVVKPLWSKEPTLGINITNEKGEYGTVWQRTKRITLDFWKICKRGTYAILCFPFTIILFPILNILLTNILIGCAKVCRFFGQKNTASKIIRFEGDSQEACIRHGNELDTKLKSLISKINPLHVILGITLPVALASTISMIFTNHLLTYWLFYPYQQLVQAIVPICSSELQATTILAICLALFIGYFALNSFLPKDADQPKEAKQKTAPNYVSFRQKTLILAITAISCCYILPATGLVAMLCLTLPILGQLIAFGFTCKRTATNQKTKSSNSNHLTSESFKGEEESAAADASLAARTTIPKDQQQTSPPSSPIISDAVGGSSNEELITDSTHLVPAGT